MPEPDIFTDNVGFKRIPYYKLETIPDPPSKGSWHPFPHRIVMKNVGSRMEGPGMNLCKVFLSDTKLAMVAVVPFATKEELASEPLVFGVTVMNRIRFQRATLLSYCIINPITLHPIPIRTYKLRHMRKARVHRMVDKAMADINRQKVLNSDIKNLMLTELPFRDGQIMIAEYVRDGIIYTSQAANVLRDHFTSYNMKINNKEDYKVITETLEVPPVTRGTTIWGMLQNISLSWSWSMIEKRIEKATGLFEKLGVQTSLEETTDED